MRQRLTCNRFSVTFSIGQRASGSIDLFENKSEVTFALTPKTPKIARAAFALYLVISLSVGDAGYWLFAIINVQTIKHEIAEMIREQCGQRQLGELTLANDSFSLGECVWTEKGREFLYHNEMYDVVASMTHDDSTTYRCFKDTKENDFRCLVNRRASDDDVSTPSIRFLHLKIVKDYTEHDVTDRLFSSAELYTLQFIHFYQNPPSDHHTPPPKFC